MTRCREFDERNTLSPSSVINVELTDKLENLLDDFERVGSKTNERFLGLYGILHFEESITTSIRIMKKENGESVNSQDIKEQDETVIDELSQDEVDFPKILEQPINNFTDMSHLVFEKYPELQKLENFVEMMIDVRDHFRLLESLNRFTTLRIVERTAERLNIDRTKAVDWIIFDKLPSIYNLLESKLGYSYADEVIKTNRTESMACDSFVEGEYLE